MLNKSDITPDALPAAADTADSAVSDVSADNAAFSDIPADGTVSDVSADNAAFSDIPADGTVSDVSADNAAFSDIPADSTAAKPLTDKEVTQYTAELWKYEPVPEDEPEPAPEYACNSVSFPGGDVTAARVRGKKHKHEGSNCDDWYEIAGVEDIIFAAVSDGAGSKKFSRIGARESCRAAVGYMVHAFKNLLEKNPELDRDLSLEFSDPKCMESCGILANIVQQAVVKAYEAVEAAFYSRSADTQYSDILKRSPELNDFAATLLLTAVIPAGGTEREHLVISCQIGDGAIALLDSAGGFDGSLKIMGIPDSGSFSGETEFLTSQKRSIESLQLRTKISKSVFDTVLMMTDGVADDYFPGAAEFRRLYYDLIINGIIPRQDTVSADLTPRRIGLLRKIPDPVAYPWINDKNIRIPVQYAKRICEAAQMSLEDVWNDPDVLDLARLEMIGMKEIAADPAERLKIWLDNYVERGSFDDRTLVVIRI